MISADQLYDEALDCRLAFPNRRGKSMRLFLWDYVRKNDWGFRITNGLTNRDTREDAVVIGNRGGNVGCVAYVLACTAVLPTIGVRNLWVTPLYERRIRDVVRDLDSAVDGSHRES